MGIKNLALKLGVKNLVDKLPPYTDVSSNGSHAAGYPNAQASPLGPVLVHDGDLLLQVGASSQAGFLRKPVFIFAAARDLRPFADVTEVSVRGALPDGHKGCNYGHDESARAMNDLQWK